MAVPAFPEHSECTGIVFRLPSGQATHNWCFNSAVVHAQMYVVGRAALNSMASLMLQDDPDRDEQKTPARPPRSEFSSSWGHFSALWTAIPGPRSEPN